MSDPISAAKCANNQDSRDPTGPCPLKGGSVGFVPVRYAFDNGYEQDDQTPRFTLPKKWQGEAWIEAEHSQRTLRQLRDGWLYVYDQDADRLDEYQVSGTKLIKKLDDDSDGETSSRLNYPVKHTVYLAFSHLRWTARLKTLMQEKGQLRSAWMRELDLDYYRENMAHPHTGSLKQLGQSVIDIGEESAPAGLFTSTCTPLDEIDDLETDDQDDQQHQHVAHKPGSTVTDYKVDLEKPNEGFFVALDDRLADVTDLFFPLSTDVQQLVGLQGDEDTTHKLQMAEITRALGRVKLPEEKLPSHIRNNPIQVLEFERDLSEYVALQQRSNQVEGTTSNSVYYNTDAPITAEDKLAKETLDFLSESAMNAKLQLEDKYDTQVDESLVEEASRQSIFTDEVDWEALDQFLSDHYSQLQGLDERIATRYKDFMHGIEQLSTDPAIVGVDNQDTDHLVYLLSLISQYLVGVKHAINNEEAHAELNKVLDFDQPANLLALASVGFSKDNWQALNDEVQKIEHHFLALDSSADMSALVGAIESWNGFTGDVRIQEKEWFQSFAEPVKKSFAALQHAVSGAAEQTWRATTNLLFPSQMNTTSSPLGMISNLRLVILEAIVNPEAIVAHNPDYPAQVSAWQRKVNAEVAMITRISQPPVGQPTPKNHQIKSMHAAQQRLQKLLSSELPQMVMLKHQAANDAAKKMLNQTIDRIWQKGAQVAQTSWNKLGNMGGILAILNIWNSASVLHNIRYKAEQHPETSLWANPALREATYSTAYAVSQVAGLWRDAAWKKIIADKKLLEISLSEALDVSVTSEKARLRAFTRATAMVSLFGFIAAGLEAWDSYKKYDDLSNTPMESLGYILKGVATGSQAVVFLAQAVANFASRFGILGTSIGSIIATWMMTTLMVAGILSLLAVLIINLVKRSELEVWLLHSTWGKQTKQWVFLEELKRLEHIINKPQIQLNAIPNQNTSQRMNLGTEQWQLELILPAFTRDTKIGLQVTRKPKDKNYHYRVAEPKPAVVVNEQRGTWSKEKISGNPIYRLDIGGSTNDTVAVLVSMPFAWQVSESEMLGYVAVGSHQGELTVNPAPKDKKLGNRNIEVRVD
ncbi:hypothetical protein BZG20_13585 [Salinivibrio sp. IB868]|uniref:T6SS effector BTH_I2691 family protein n=1 Tax=unclassified Salinivibrio TaxID=2636825 RepID=UPI000986DD56|nr:MULTISPECIES: T6SS effector BTH_I2691 family protein [unclassified Salinivibrio]OOE65134.1 hypothetical protein BZG20_13585 [Salinivibrio sp. IB868]OOE70781.1 hypothetical protein BZG22_15745 [Salinivibrio sp. IB870]